MTFSLAKNLTGIDQLDLALHKDFKSELLQKTAKQYLDSIINDAKQTPQTIARAKHLLQREKPQSFFSFGDPLKDIKKRARSGELLACYDMAHLYEREKNIRRALTLHTRFIFILILNEPTNKNNYTLSQNEIHWRLINAFNFLATISADPKNKYQAYAIELCKLLMVALKNDFVIRQIQTWTVTWFMFHFLKTSDKTDVHSEHYKSGIMDSIELSYFDYDSEGFQRWNFPDRSVLTTLKLIYNRFNIMPFDVKQLEPRLTEYFGLSSVKNSTANIVIQIHSDAKTAVAKLESVKEQNVSVLETKVLPNPLLEKKPNFETDEMDYQTQHSRLTMHIGSANL